MIHITTVEAFSVADGSQHSRCSLFVQLVREGEDVGLGSESLVQGRVIRTRVGLVRVPLDLLVVQVHDELPDQVP